VFAWLGTGIARLSGPRHIYSDHSIYLLLMTSVSVSAVERGLFAFNPPMAPDRSLEIRIDRARSDF